MDYFEKMLTDAMKTNNKIIETIKLLPEDNPVVIKFNKEANDVVFDQIASGSAQIRLTGDYAITQP